MVEKSRPQILVTGAAGALAQQVISRLRDTCNLVAVDFREQVYLGDDIPSYCIDFNKRSFEDLFRRYRFDGVIHLGRIMSSQLTRMRRYNANVLGTQKLLDLSHKYNIKRVVVLSTFHVLWRYPDLNITILRPCNIVGPGVRNSISTLLGMERAPVLAGFSPMMQFIHIDDMADAIVLAYNKPQRGIFNVAPQDWVAYQHDTADTQPAKFSFVPDALFQVSCSHRRQGVRQGIRFHSQAPAKRDIPVLPGEQEAGVNGTGSKSVPLWKVAHSAGSETC